MIGILRQRHHDYLDPWQIQKYIQKRNFEWYFARIYRAFCAIVLKWIASYLESTFGSGNGLMLSGNKPSSEPLLINNCVDIFHHCRCDLTDNLSNIIVWSINYDKPACIQIITWLRNRLPVCIQIITWLRNRLPVCIQIITCLRNRLPVCIQIITWLRNRLPVSTQIITWLRNRLLIRS